MCIGVGWFGYLVWVVFVGYLLLLCELLYCLFMVTCGCWCLLCLGVCGGGVWLLVGWRLVCVC